MTHGSIFFPRRVVVIAIECPLHSSGAGVVRRRHRGGLTELPSPGDSAYHTSLLATLPQHALW